MTAREVGHIRDLVELHWRQFDARLEQRLAKLKAKLRADFYSRIDALRMEAGLMVGLVKG